MGDNFVYTTCCEFPIGGGFPIWMIIIGSYWGRGGVEDNLGYALRKLYEEVGEIAGTIGYNILNFKILIFLG